jgi:hypothetical protein
MTGEPRILIKGAHVLSQDERLGEFVGDVLVADGRIADVGADLADDRAEIVDGTGHALLPCFVDTHRHAWQGALRSVGPTWTYPEYRAYVQIGLGPPVGVRPGHRRYPRAGHHPHQLGDTAGPVADARRAAADAQRCAGQLPTAEPFTRTQRRVGAPPGLRLGIACDVSGSMSPVVGSVASAAWILAAAARHTRVDTTTASLVFGRAVHPIVRPGEHPSKVSEFSADDCYEAADRAIDALDGALGLSKSACRYRGRDRQDRHRSAARRNSSPPPTQPARRRDQNPQTPPPRTPLPDPVRTPLRIDSHPEASPHRHH